MTRQRLLAIGGGSVAIVVIVLGFQAGRRELALEREREAPVVAPTRLREIETRGLAEAAVVLDSATEALIGLRTAVLRTATSSVASGVRLTGELIADPARVTIIRAPVSGRVASIGDWPALGEGLASGRAVAQVSDAQPLEVPRAGVVTRVSVQPGELVQAGQELLQLTDFREPLARIVWRMDLAAAPPATLLVTPLGRQIHGARGRYVGPAADVDSLTRAPVYLYRLATTWPEARPGLPIVVALPDERSSGTSVFVPTDAVVQWEGLAWVYVPRALPGRERVGARAFVRMRIDTSHPVDGGWLVAATPAGLNAGASVVVQGAQQLLSEEFRARIQVGVESR